MDQLTDHEKSKLDDRKQIKYKETYKKLTATNQAMGKQILKNKRLTRKGRVSDMIIVMEDGTMISGYALANPKRNKDFHNYFNEISLNEHLINDYSCALQKEILIQGKIFVSLKHICFHANIFGWVTNTVIPFSDITAIEKKMSAIVIPNAILIITRKSKYLFASFLSRDIVYDLFMKLWKYSNPRNSSSEYRISQARFKSDDNNTFYQRIEKTPITVTEHNDQDSDFPIEMDETICDCLKNNQHFDNKILDTKFIGSVEKIYNLLYTSGFIFDFLKCHEKNDCINMGQWARENGKLVRYSNYIKRLSKIIEPTKCKIKDEVLHQDFDNFATVITSIETPNIPSVNTSFVIKTRTCIMRAGSNGARIIVTCTVEFSKLTPYKDLIEKESLEGRTEYYKTLETAVRKYISQNISEFDEENGAGDIYIDNFHASIKQNPTIKKKKSSKLKERTTISTKSNVRTFLLIAFTLTLMIHIYIWINLKNVTRSMEKYSGQKNDGIEFNGDCTLNEWLGLLKRKQLFSILDENQL